MKPKLNLFLLLFASLNLFTFSISKALNYPIQVNNSFSIQSANQFDLNQIETLSSLQSRMKTLLQFGEIFPTGLYVEAGASLKLNVSSLAGTHAAYGKVIITDRYAGGGGGSYTQTVNLINGNNTINVTVSGNIFISYADSNPNPSRKLRFTFNSGYTAMPCFVKDQTTTAEWLDMLQNYNATPDVMFIFKRGTMVLDRIKIDTYKNNDFNKIITALSDIVEVELEGSGIITTNNQSDKNRDFGNLLYFTSNDSEIPGRVTTSNPHATNPGLIRVPIDWIATTDHIFTGGAWGISHEIGHHIQQNAWDWGGNTEVQVNIGTMMARKMLYPASTGMESNGSWRISGFYLTKDKADKNYDTFSDLKAKIPLFWQLQMAFGNNDFYKRFYTYVRENAVNSGSASVEKLNFMKTANTIAGKNLRDYFIQWGLNPTTTQINTLNGMGLALPTISPLTFSEGNLIENFTLLNDTTVYEGQAINYRVVAMATTGVKKVEFYDGATKIGESTGFPFQLTFTPTFGVHPITAKLIDPSDNVLATTTVKNVTVTRIQITSPTNRSSLMLGNNVLIKASVAQIQGNSINKVEFYADATKIGESTSYPYQFVMNNPSAGVYKLVAKVYYQNGDISSSTIVVVSIGGLFPDADTYVRDGSYAGNNYGLSGDLELKTDNGTGYNRYAYFRFKLSDLMENAYSSAKLRLNITINNPSVANKTDWNLYFVSDDTWEEKAITFNSQPTTGDLLATQRAVANGAIEWDITNQLNTELAGDKYISLVLKSSTVGSTYTGTFASKENDDISLSPILKLVSAEASPIETKIVSPNESDWFNPGEDLTIKANTSIKSSNPLQKIEFYVNGNKLGEISNQPFEYVYTQVARGQYAAVAKAYYQDGTISTSASVNFLVGSLSPQADAYVQDGTSANTNFGTAESLVVKKDGKNFYRETYLRFKLSDLTASNYAKAMLRLNIVSTNTNVTINNNQWELYFIEDDTWTETGISFNNKPEIGDFLTSIPAVKNGAVEWDITNQLNTELTGDKYISLLLVATQLNGTSDVKFASKEHTDLSLRPILQLYTSTEVLPVSFISFNAQADGNHVKLTWSTASESNNAYFEVEKSTDGINFSLLRKVIAQGNSTVKTNYSTYDNNPAQTTYYRLSQVDNDGVRVTLGSAVVSFKLDKAIQVSAYPNPATTQVSLSIAAYTGKVLVTVKDVNGKSLKQYAGIASQGQTLVFDVSDLASGIYFFEISGNNFKKTEKVIVK